MTLNEAFAKRAKQILKEKKMTIYELRKQTGLYNSTIYSVLGAKVKASNFNTMVVIIQALGLTIAEFFNNPIFDYINLDVD